MRFYAERGDRVEVFLPYGGKYLSFEIPKRNLLAVLEPSKIPGARSSEEIRQKTLKALENPIGTKKLSELVKRGDKVVIVADDNTRPTPTEDLIPPLLDKLNEAGILDEDITIVIALGTHRYMTKEEILEKFGKEVVERVEIINHEWMDPKNLVYIGGSSKGTPIIVNKIVYEADFKIGVGNIVPHHIPGYAGGGKIVAPGISSPETVASFHMLSVRSRRHWLGIPRNPVRDLIDEIARKTGVHTILNTTLNADKEVVGVFFGDLQEAWLKGVESAREIYGVKSPGKADIVVASSYPCELEFWQAHKALYPADIVVKDGGTIIIVSPCPEGVAVTHPEVLELTQKEPEEIDRAVNLGEVKDVVAASLAIAWGKVRRRADIILVSEGISEEETEKLGFKYAETIDEALKMAFKKHGDNARIVAIPHGCDTLPILE
ncbi:MAG: nickel-dependent lactate racemase [Candidatus Njordarchaeales archaeon]